jgi:Ca2+-binding EF-hand superfamily protein
MKSGTRKTGSRLAALLLGTAMSSACAVDQTGMSESGQFFKDHDANRDGYLSLEEFKAKGKDDLAFKAADIDGDERLDRSEFDKYLIKKANEQSKPGN